MLNPLIIAEAANPEWVSVPLIGWSHARAIQRAHGGHIVTQIRNAAAFRRAGVPDSDYTAIDSEAIASPLNKVGKFLSGGSGGGWTTKMAASSLSYYFFERLVWEQFGERIRNNEYSLVHRLTPVSHAVPSMIARKCERSGVPFVIGPLNGGLPWPPGFGAERRREGEWLSYVRGFNKLLPGYRSTRHHAAAIICGSRHTMKQLPSGVRDKTFFVPENGVDSERFTRTRTRSASKPLRCIFIGRLVPCKGCDMLLHAIAGYAKDDQLVLTLLGDGPERARLESVAKELGISHAVSFLGNVPHQEVQRHLLDSDLLTFPSIRDFGGGVILEAMAVGVPQMAVDYGGPGELMSDETSFPIAMGTRDMIVDRIRQALRAILDDPSQIDKKSSLCVGRVRNFFTWEAKADQIGRIYKWALGERGRPDIRFDVEEKVVGDMH